MNSLHWMTEQDKQALATVRRERRYVAELNQDLADFRELAWFGVDQRQKDWAQMMVKSVEHELEEIEAGRLGVPEYWQA